MRIMAIVVVTFVLVALAGSDAFAYPVPEVSKATLILDESQITEGGKDKKPGPVIAIKTYRRADDKLFRQYSVEGKVFRYDIDEDGSAPYEYRILDKDGDGEFETREKLIGDVGKGEDGEKYYIDLGEEPGKEYKYLYEEEAGKTTPREDKMILDGYSIYVPAWVLVEFQ